MHAFRKTLAVAGAAFVAALAPFAFADSADNRARCEGAGWEYSPNPAFGEICSVWVRDARGGRGGGAPFCSFNDPSRILCRDIFGDPPEFPRRISGGLGTASDKQIVYCGGDRVIDTSDGGRRCADRCPAGYVSDGHPRRPECVCGTVPDGRGICRDFRAECEESDPAVNPAGGTYRAEGAGASRSHLCRAARDAFTDRGMTCRFGADGGADGREPDCDDVFRQMRERRCAEKGAQYHFGVRGKISCDCPGRLSLAGGVCSDGGEREACETVDPEVNPMGGYYFDDGDFTETRLCNMINTKFLARRQGILCWFNPEPGQENFHCEKIFAKLRRLACLENNAKYHPTYRDIECVCDRGYVKAGNGCRKDEED